MDVPVGRCRVSVVSDRRTMFFYHTFPILTAVLSIIIGRSCGWRARRFFMWWIPTAIAMGVSGLFIPWRGANGSYHGSGSPVPLVIWERSADGGFHDFPFPGAPFINVAVVFMLGA